MLVLFYRQDLLARLPPDFMGGRFAPAFTQAQLRKLSGPRTVLEGHPVLIVGDSLVRAWPWPADMLCSPGFNAPMLRDQLAQELGSHTYRLIVLWPGTAHISRMSSVDSYVTAVADMVALAQTQAEQVIVISPMPYDEAQARVVGILWAAMDTPVSLDTVAVVGEVVAALRARVPDLYVHDLGILQADVMERQEIDLYYQDGVHLSRRGFARLRQDLARAGVDVAP